MQLCDRFGPVVFIICYARSRPSAEWQDGLWSFQTGGIKLERFLPKNQHTQTKCLNFENWTNKEPQALSFYSFKSHF